MKGMVLIDGLDLYGSGDWRGPLWACRVVSPARRRHRSTGVWAGHAFLARSYADRNAASVRADGIAYRGPSARVDARQVREDAGCKASEANAPQRLRYLRAMVSATGGAGRRRTANRSRDYRSRWLSPSFGRWRCHHGETGRGGYRPHLLRVAAAGLRLHPAAAGAALVRSARSRFVRRTECGHHRRGAERARTGGFAP